MPTAKVAAKCEECGVEFWRPSALVKRSTRKFCGLVCMSKWRSRESRKHGEGGPNRTKEYRAWAHIMGRCHNPSDNSYKSYGGRGIKVAAAWQADFAAFLADVGHAPSPLHTLDRIDNDGNYEPGNVRWATRAEQNRNTRRTVMVNGKCLKDACAEAGVSYEAAQARIRRGELPEAAVQSLKEKQCGVLA